MSYESQGLQVPEAITAHSTRSASTSAGFDTNASVADFCKVATWASVSTFVRQYKMDSYHHSRCSICVASPTASGLVYAW